MKFKFDEIVELKGQKLTKNYIASLSKSEREELIEPIFQLFREQGLTFPDDLAQVDKEWKRVQECQIDITANEIYNNSSLGTYISKYFCADKFYNTKNNIKTKSIQEIYNDNDLLKKLIANRLGLSWYEQEPGSTFNLSPKMLIQGLRSMRLAGFSQTSIFKPEISLFITRKYSEPGDTIYDPSAGWGARMLGAAASKRKYIGVDPFTVPELTKMKNHLKLEGITLIESGSEDYTPTENSIDFSYSSPVYWTKEIFSTDPTQANMKGEDYFYNIYWKKTLDNIYKALKPGKFFGLNLTEDMVRMIEMAKKIFGDPVEVLKLRTVKSHLNKYKDDKSDAQKYEPVFIYFNDK